MKGYYWLLLMFIIPCLCMGREDSAPPSIIIQQSMATGHTITRFIPHAKAESIVFPITPTIKPNTPILFTIKQWSLPIRELKNSPLPIPPR